MSSIISNSSLDNLNIDTVERAILFCTLCLQGVVGQAEENLNLRQKVRLAILGEGKSEVVISIDVKLRLQLYLFGSSGGTMLEAVTPFSFKGISAIDSLFDFDTFTPSVPIEPIRPNHPNLNFIEEVLYYYSALLYGAITEDRNKYITISPNISSFEEAELNLRVKLPLNATKLGSGFPLIECVRRIVATYDGVITEPSPTEEPTEEPTPNYSELTDSQYLTDDDYLED